MTTSYRRRIEGDFEYLQYKKTYIFLWIFEVSLWKYLPNYNIDEVVQGGCKYFRSKDTDSATNFANRWPNVEDYLKFVQEVKAQYWEDKAKFTNYRIVNDGYYDYLQYEKVNLMSKSFSWYYVPNSHMYSVKKCGEPNLKRRVNGDLEDFAKRWPNIKEYLEIVKANEEAWYRAEDEKREAREAKAKQVTYLKQKQGTYLK